jgi:hypothetical protein
MDPLENAWETDDSFGGLVPVTLPLQIEIPTAAVMKLIQYSCSNETLWLSEMHGCVNGQMSCSVFVDVNQKQERVRIAGHH